MTRARLFWLSLIFLLYAAVLAAVTYPEAFPSAEGSYTPPDRLWWLNGGAG